MTETPWAGYPQQLRIVLNRAEVDVRDLAEFVTALDTFSLAASMAGQLTEPLSWPPVTPVHFEADAPFLTPRVISVHNESPVTVVLESLPAPMLLGFIAYMIKHPALVPTMLARYKIDRDLARARSQAAAFWASQIDQLILSQQVDVSELPEPPDWIFGQN